MHHKREDWGPELDAIEAYFQAMDLPETMRMKQWVTIIDVSKFIRAHLEICRANNGNNVFLPYLNRLRKLRRVLWEDWEDWEENWQC